jgi:DNA ligase (NAD+)
MSLSKAHACELHISLCKELKKLEHFYHTGMPLVSDEVYDHKYRTLQELESLYKEWLDLSISPTQIIGVIAGTVPHLTPMLSIQNCWDSKQFMAFIKRIGQDTDLVCEPKYDGVAISLTYANGQLIQALTRGDGTMGESVLRVVRHIPSIPSAIADIRSIVLRGELLIHNEDFKQFNLTHSFSNPRNLVAGSLRQIDNINQNCLNLIKFYPYGIEDSPYLTHMDDIELLKYLGFQVHRHILHTQDVSAMLEFYHSRLQYKDLFASDGVVYKVNNHARRFTLGNSMKYHKFMIAYKFPSESTTALLIAIHYSVGRTGVITPIAEIEPVVLDGAKITKASLFNFSFIIDRNIKVGSKLVLKRAGGVIPYILDSVDMQPHILAELPTHCPCCSSLLSKYKKASRCMNIDCADIAAQMMLWRASKSIFNIVGCDIGTIQILQKHGLIQHFFDLYKLRYEDLIQLPRFSKRKSTNLLNSIATRSEVSLVQSIMFLAIPGIGRSGSISLSKKITKITDLFRLTIADLQDIEGFGGKTSESIIRYLALPSTYSLIINIEEYVQIS